MKAVGFRQWLGVAFVMLAGSALYANSVNEEIVVACGERAFWLGPNEIVVAYGERALWLGPDEFTVAYGEGTFSLEPCDYAAWSAARGLTGVDAAWNAKPAVWGGAWANAFIYTYGEGLADGTLPIMAISFDAMGKPVITTPPVVKGHADFTPAVIGAPAVDGWTAPIVLENAGGDWILPAGKSANFFRVRLSE